MRVKREMVTYAYCRATWSATNAYAIYSNREKTTDKMENWKIILTKENSYLVENSFYLEITNNFHWIMKYLSTNNFCTHKLVGLKSNCVEIENLIQLFTQLYVYIINNSTFFSPHIIQYYI